MHYVKSNPDDKTDSELHQYIMDVAINDQVVVTAGSLMSNQIDKIMTRNHSVRHTIDYKGNCDMSNQESRFCSRFEFMMF
jgi:hypothetical protein